MFQSVMRDPEGDCPVRIISNEDLVNGSLLVVPADTVAIFVLNGRVVNVYPPGRYSLYTGVDPFFVRFRNLMTRGDAGITCQVFFVNTRYENVVRDGTGEIIIHAKISDNTGIPVKVKSAYTMRYVITDAQKFISRFVGMHNSYFDNEDLQPKLKSMVLPVVKPIISRALSGASIYEIQSGLLDISNSARARLERAFGEYGITLRSVDITSINIVEEDMARFNEFLNEYVKRRLAIEGDVYEIDTIYDGDILLRILEEWLAGIYRGEAKPIPTEGGVRSIGDAMVTYPMIQEVAPILMRSLTRSLTNGSSSGHVTATGPESNTGAGSRRTPPPLPAQKRHKPK